MTVARHAGPPSRASARSRTELRISSASVLPLTTVVTSRDLPSCCGDCSRSASYESFVEDPLAVPDELVELSEELGELSEELVELSEEVDVLSDELELVLDEDDSPDSLALAFDVP